MNVSEFGKLADGRRVRIFTLKNKNGMTADVMEYGATLVSLSVPNRKGDFEDVVLGYDSLAGYVGDNIFMGSIVGRYGNRIKGGSFSLNGTNYKLVCNDGNNHLHGGPEGFYKLFWNAERTDHGTGSGVKLRLNSPDGDQGYPGNVRIEVSYYLTDENELHIEYAGETDKKTILNPTNHAYFNLSANANNDILDHALQIKGGHITAIDEESIPTGEKMKVENSPFDFRTTQVIGKHIVSDHTQVKNGGGYDHNWVLDDYSQQIRTVASLYHPASGRYMEVLTDQPGLQFYSGNFLDGTITGKKGIHYQFRTGLCLETQHFPDSPNNPDFPSVVLKPGEQYKQTTIYKFSVR